MLSGGGTSIDPGSPNCVLAGGGAGAKDDSGCTGGTWWNRW